MKNHRPIIRNATTADIVAFYGEAPSFAIRALVADLDGEIIAIGGLAYHPNRMLAFSDMKEPMRDYPILIYKSAKKVIKLIEKYGGGVVAVASDSESNSNEFLKRLGFIEAGEFKNMEVYSWIHSQQQR
tara:strand:- start:3076 stop:3462 length:387 start_codon:yes stop_codon:yes gene_type:complete